MSDDDLIDRIRRATPHQGAPVPALDDVLRATRRRRTWPLLARAAALLLAFLAGVAADRAALRPSQTPAASAGSGRTEVAGPAEAAARQAIAARPGGLGASLAVLAAFDGKH